MFFIKFILSIAIKPAIMTIDPLTVGLIVQGVGGLLGGLFAGGESPQEKAYARIQQTLEESEDYFKSTPFTKEEIMGELLPQVQQIFRGSADVLAGKIGARTGESGMAGGQSAMDYYIQSVAPVIAQGENLAAGAVGQFANFWATLDNQAKNRFLESVKTQLAAAAGAPTETAGQRAALGFLSGADIASTAFGNITKASSLYNQADDINSILKKMSSGGDVETTSRDAISTGVTTDFTSPTEQGLVEIND